MRLEGAGFRDRDHPIEQNPVILLGRLQHVGCERGRHFRKRLELLDLADEVAHLIMRMRDAGTVHHMRDRAVPDLAIGRVPAMQQRIDHRVLEMRAPPPGDEGIGIAAPALRLQEGRGDGDEPALHVHDRAVLVEHADLDAGFDGLGAHGDLRCRHLKVAAARAGRTVSGRRHRPDCPRSAGYRRQRSSSRRRRSRAPASRPSSPSVRRTVARRRPAS